MSFVMNRLFITLLIMVFATAISAQNGEIKGNIKDAQTGETLFGCNILIQGTTIGTISDMDGNFTIPNVKPGNYNVIISFVSFEQNIIRVLVENGGSATINVALKPNVVSIKEARVVGQRRNDTEISLLKSIKATNLIANGISAQQISRTLDKDAAEVIKRVPGITIKDGRFVVVRGLSERYNSVILNGASAPSSEQDVRSFSFDGIPSNLIDNILIYKTPAPELPADFAGAAINVITKNSVNENGFEISLSTGAINGVTGKEIKYQKGGSLDWLGFDDGTRALPENLPSTSQLNEIFNEDDGTPADILEQRNIQKTEFAKSFNNDAWTVLSKKALPEFSGNLLFKRRFTIDNVTATNITSVNYKLKTDNDLQQKRQFYTPDSTGADHIYNFNDRYYTRTSNLGVIHNWMLVFGNNHKIEFRNFFNQMGNNKLIERNGVDYQQDTILGYSIDFTSRTTYSGQLAGKINLGNNSSLNLLTGYSYANRNEPDVRRFQYRKYYREDSPYNGMNRIVISNQPTPEYGGRLFFDTNENVYNGAIDWDQNLNKVFKSLKLKAGLFYEKKNRTFDTRRFGIFSTKNPRTHASDISDSMMFIPFDQFAVDANFYNNGGLMMKDVTLFSDSYNVNSDLFSAYTGFQFSMINNKLNLYTGVRMENYSRNLSGYQKDNAGSISYTTQDLFPSANLSFNFTEKQLLRLAYGKTINRPEFREVAPFYYIDFERYATSQGDTALVSAYINNFDLRYEWYPTPSEMISLSVFYKDFKNPIENALIASSGNAWVYKPFNTQKAYSRGIELEIRKSLSNFEESNSMLLRSLKDMTIIFNTSLIESQIEDFSASARDSLRALQGQSPYIVNLGLYYDNTEKGIMASLSYNVIGEKIIAVGTKSGTNAVKTPHTYELPRNVIDFTLSKRFGNNLVVKLGIKDLLEEPVRYVQRWKVETAGNSKTLELETFRGLSNRTISLGATYKF